MRSLKQVRRQFAERLIEGLCANLARSGRFRRAALRHLFKHHMAPSSLAFVSFPDHAVFVDPRDHMIAFRLVSGEAWQRAEFSRALEITRTAGALRPAKWFVDVGANIGTQSIYAMLSGEFCGVVAIEPEQHNVALLRRNLSHNGFADRAHVVELAASSRQGSAKLHRDLENFGAHSLSPLRPRRSDSWIDVTMRPLDDILEDLGIRPIDIGLVLIDVEGHEIEVLKGMEHVRRQRVPIVAEVSGGTHGASGIAELRALLAEHYDRIAHLRTPDSREARLQHLDGFDFGTRQTDVLICNTGAAEPCR